MSFKVGSKLFWAGEARYIELRHERREVWRNMEKVVKFGAINERIGADEAKNFTAFL